MPDKKTRTLEKLLAGTNAGELLRKSGERINIGDEEILLSIPNDPKYLSITRGVASGVLEKMKFSDKERARMMLALDEACSNIMRHSCGEGQAIMIGLRFCIHSDALEVFITDFGECGDKLDIDNVVEKDNSPPCPGGFGLGIIMSVMDEVEYTPATKYGNILRLYKKIC